MRIKQFFLIALLLSFYHHEISAGVNPLSVKKTDVSSYITQNGIPEDGRKINDNNLYTAWQYSYDSNVVSADFYFEKKVSIDKVKLFNGYGKSYKLFLRNGRVKTLIFSIGNSKKVFNLLTEIYDFEELSLGFKNVKNLKMTIKSVKKGSKYNDIAISDISFYGKGGPEKQLDFSGMVPLIFKDKYRYSRRDKSSRNFKFNFRYGDKNNLYLFWYGFFDPASKNIIKLGEGYNRVIPAGDSGNYILKREYHGWGMGVFHPFINQTSVFNPKTNSIKFITNKIGRIKVYSTKFSGNVKFGSIGSPDDYDKEKKNLCFDYDGIEYDCMDEKTREINLVRYNKKNGLVSSLAGWKYKSGLVNGKMYYLGKGLFALHISGKYDECCSICINSGVIFLFNSKGFIKKIKFPAKKNIFPFELRLAEDPCSA